MEKSTKTFFNDEEWQAQMEQVEDEILSYCKAKVSKYFVNIQMEGKPFRVRVYESGNNNNKTLVFV